MEVPTIIIISIIEMIAIIILVIITGLYAKYTSRMVKEMQIERRIAYLEKQLEKLYLPLERNRDLITGIHHGPFEYEAWEKERRQFITDVHRHSYLARPKLKDILNDYLLNVEDGITQQQGENYSVAILESLEIDEIVAELKGLIK